MRQNNGVGKVLKGVYSVYRVTGANTDLFINRIAKRNITLYNVKKKSKNQVVFTVSYAESDKIFALNKDLCYNIKKIRDKGVAYPLLFLMRNVGVAIGVALFVAICILADNIVYSIEFCGSGAIYESRVRAYLDVLGVTRFSRFSDIDLDALGEKIIQSGETFSFATCKKRGNRLIVELVLAESKPDTLNGNVYELKADVDGIVEDIKVYRGTALVNVGDVVSAGDVLVDGFAVVKEQKVTINVIAYVTVRSVFAFEYVSEKDGEEDVAVIMARLSLGEDDVVCEEVEKTAPDGGFVYKVKLNYRRTLHAG